MKKPKLSDNYKKVVLAVFLVLLLLVFGFLIAFKDQFNKAPINLETTETVYEIQNEESFFIDSAYNYTQNGLKYELTFLEFGAENCSSCKRMETVLDEIRAKYYNRVNVVFLNVRLKKNRQIMRHFGIKMIPTQVLLNKEAKEFFRHTGYYSTEELQSHLLE